MRDLERLPDLDWSIFQKLASKFADLCVGWWWISTLRNTKLRGHVALTNCVTAALPSFSSHAGSSSCQTSQQSRKCIILGAVVIEGLVEIIEVLCSQIRGVD